MSESVYEWLLVGHLIGVILWIAAMTATYWLLRVHATAPKDVLDKLTLMERSLAMVMDLSATLAIGCGLGMAFSAGGPRGTHPTTSLFGAPHAAWFHIKLTAVVLGILPVHGVVRGRLAKFSRGQISGMPSWPWSLLLGAIVVIIVMVVRGPTMFAPTP